MAAPTITPSYLRTQFENLVDDTHNVTHTYQLLTQAKNYVERMMKLAVLQASDETQTLSPGNTYTSLKLLPTDFRSMISVYVGQVLFLPVPFAKRVAYRNVARRYYIDYKKQVQNVAALGITGTAASAQTIQQNYLVGTPDLTEANENTAGIILWPDEFQPIIPYIAARIFQANIDPDDIAIRQSIAQDVEMQHLWDAMVAWDHDIKLAEMGGAGGHADEEVETDLGLM